jgi:hypothetical protein
MNVQTYSGLTAQHMQENVHLKNRMTAQELSRLMQQTFIAKWHIWSVTTTPTTCDDYD